MREVVFVEKVVTCECEFVLWVFVGLSFSDEWRQLIKGLQFVDDFVYMNQSNQSMSVVYKEICCPRFCIYRRERSLSWWIWFFYYFFLCVVGGTSWWTSFGLGWIVNEAQLIVLDRIFSMGKMISFLVTLLAPLLFSYT